MTAKGDDVDATFERLARLEDDWDGYEARRPSWIAIGRAIKFLDLVSTPPIVVPLSGGGVQLEWNLPEDGVLEIEFTDDDILISLPPGRHDSQR